MEVFEGWTEACGSVRRVPVCGRFSCREDELVLAYLGFLLSLSGIKGKFLFQAS